ncbi:hypothetical protein HOY82DRAFT_519055 [Tuber indicum]|nr:hypothetical protein HOY82DRAFT_519055 [Tuber indicum]
MDYQPYTPLRRDGPHTHSVFPNIHFTPGNSSPRPIQRQLSTSFNYIPSRFLDPISSRSRIPATKNITPVSEEKAAPIRGPKSAFTRECVKKFKDWHSGKGAFSSPESRENGLTMEMTMPYFLDFKRALDIDENERFPKYSYDALSSLLTIQCMSSPIQEKVVSTVSEGFTLARRSLPASLRGKIDIVVNQKYTDFQGAYDGSEKTPDTAVEITNDAGVTEVRFILKVGFTESYSMLVQDAKKWIEGREAACIVMIVNMEESSVDKFPTRNLNDKEFSQLRFPPRREIGAEIFTLEGPYGPACYEGLHCVGGIIGFMEIWKRDSVTKFAIRLLTPLNSNLLNMANTTYVHFRLKDFMNIASDNDHLPIDWGNYISNLERYIKQVAAERYRRAIGDCEGRVDMSD